MRQPLLAGALLFNTVQSEADQWNDYRYDHPLRTWQASLYTKQSKERNNIFFSTFSAIKYHI